MQAARFVNTGVQLNTVALWVGTKETLGESGVCLTTRNSGLGRLFHRADFKDFERQIIHNFILKRPNTILPQIGFGYFPVFTVFSLCYRKQRQTAGSQTFHSSEFRKD